MTENNEKQSTSEDINPKVTYHFDMLETNFKTSVV